MQTLFENVYGKFASLLEVKQINIQTRVLNLIVHFIHSSFAHLTPELTRHAHEASYQTEGFNDESHAIAGSG
jgi:hypothetical protein